MSIVRYASVYLAFLLAAFVSGLVTATRLTGSSSVFDGDAPSWHVLLESSDALAALVAIVGVVVAVVVQRTAAAGSLAGASLLVLAVCASVGFDDGWLMYAAAVGCGALIGALCGLSRVRGEPQRGQTCLFAGLLAGVVLAIPLEQAITDESWFDRGASDASVDWTVLLLAVAAAALLVVALFCTSAEETNESTAQGRAVVVGVGVPLCSLLLYWWWVGDGVRDVDRGGVWLGGYALVPIALIGALCLPARSGLVLVSLIAFLSSTANDKLWNSGWSVVVGTVILIAAAAVIGRVWHYPLIGIAILVPCTLTGFLDQSASNSFAVVVTLVGVSATAYSMSASAPSTAPAMAITMAAPAFSVIGIGSVFVMFGSSGDDHHSLGVTRFPSSTTEAFLSVGSVILCGLAIAYLGRRDQPPTVTAP